MSLKQAPQRNELLVQARYEHGLTQEALAERLGVDVRTVSSWERGLRTPSPHYRHKLCKLFKKALVELGLEIQPHGSDEFPRAFPRNELSNRDEHRHRMLRRIWKRWITDGLERSLHMTLLVPDLVELPEAVHNPWLAVAEWDQKPRLIPTGTSLLDLYDAADGTLLILGEPGAGKTTLLLTLAQALLEREAHQAMPLLPVVLHLAEWTQKRFSLDEWILQELQQKYYAPQPLARQWIETEQVILLLDGLDEVNSEARASCVEAINRYRQAHGLVPMVMCCRTKEYEAFKGQLCFSHALQIQPLRQEQIEQVLAQKGAQGKELQQALQRDPGLRQLAQTPFILGILCLVYTEGMERQAATYEQDAAVLLQQRQAVLACYVEHVLKRRGQRSIYTREQTLHYLAVLASQLERHGQVEFSLERMQPNWLPQRQQHQYRRWIVRLFYCLETLSLSIFFASFYGDPVSFSSGPLAWVAGKPSNEVLGWMALGLGGGFQNVTSFAVLLTVIFLLIFVLAGRVSRAHPLRLSWSLLLKRAWEGCRRGFCFGLVSGLLACFFLSLWGGIPYGLYRGFGIACLSGLCMSFASGCLALFPAPEPQNASKRGVRERLTDCVLYTLCSTCGYGLVYDVLSHESHLLILIYALIVGSPSGIIFGLANGTRLVEGMGEQIQPAEVASWQWVSWRQVLEQVRNGFLLGSWVFLAVSITFLCVAGLSQGFVYGLRYGLLFGVLAGGIGALTALFAGLFAEAWVTRMSDAEERALQRPHEGLSRSLRHAVKASLIFAALGGCGGGGISALAFALTGVPGWPLLGFRFAMICGSRFAFQFFFFHGGLAWIEHMLLRFWLWRRGVIPWNYPQFLDFAVERMLLYRMGSEYRFAHRMLQEYFATYRKNEGEEENLCADRPVHPDLMPL